jgi:hypothetical protein
MFLLLTPFFSHYHSESSNQAQAKSPTIVDRQPPIVDRPPLIATDALVNQQRQSEMFPQLVLQCQQQRQLSMYLQLSTSQPFNSSSQRAPPDFTIAAGAIGRSASQELFWNNDNSPCTCNSARANLPIHPLNGRLLISRSQQGAIAVIILEFFFEFLPYFFNHFCSI